MTPTAAITATAAAQSASLRTTLKELRVGDEAEVTGFAQGSSGYRHRLLTMGLTPGTRLRVTRLAPLGDPLEITLRGYSLSLRRDEAEVLFVVRR